MSTPFDLNVRSFTWNHDSRGLFDYESKNVFKRTYRARPTNESYMISRNGSEIGMTLNASTAANIPSFGHTPPIGDGGLSPLRIPSDLDSRCETRPLMRVFYESGQYWVDHPERSRDPSKTLWLVIRHAKGPCVVRSGDMLKMGRYKIRVREAVADAEAVAPVVPKGKRFSVCSTDSYDNITCDEDCSPAGTVDTVASVSHPLVDIQSVEVCRICYESGEESNPLISPCKCAGSMQYIHLHCLRRWMDGRLSVNNGEPGGSATTLSYFWRNLDCELCKLSYPTSVECPNSNYLVDLYELPKPEGPYIVLESNIRIPNAEGGGVTLQKGLHIMSLSKTRPAVLLGRGHDADVRINDISVSRIHGSIRLAGKSQIVIEDKGSKFGSLLGVRGPIPIEPGVPLSIQSGRTVTTISIRKPNILANIIPLCFGNSPQLANAIPNASVPVLVSECSPSVDLKQVLSAPPLGERRTTSAGFRASVASTAMHRASEALTALQAREIEQNETHV